MHNMSLIEGIYIPSPEQKSRHHYIGTHHLERVLVDEKCVGDAV